jgi:hypothetical protein
VQRGGSNGAGQIVDMKGTAFRCPSASLTDLTTSTVIDSETQVTGHGHGHPNQATTECTGVLFQGPASDFFGPALPPGVASTDIVEADLDMIVILKL